MIVLLFSEAQSDQSIERKTRVSDPCETVVPKMILSIFETTYLLENSPVTLASNELGK